MKNQLRQEAFKLYKTNPISYWVISILCGLGISAALLLEYLSSGLIIFILPLFILPFFFACQMCCFGIKFNKEITFKSHSRFFGAYFRSSFFGTYRVLMSILKALLWYLIGAVISSIVLYIVFNSIYPEFGAKFQELSSMYLLIDLNESLVVSILEDSSNGVTLFLNSVMLISTGCGLVYFVYHMFYSSLTVYLRMNLPVANKAMIKLIINSTYSKKRKLIFKDNMKLNWPLYVLFIIGLILGTLLYTFVFTDPSMIYSVAFNSYEALNTGVIFGVIMMIFYFPFFFVNMETLFNKYESDFKTGVFEASKKVLSRIQSAIDLEESEKEEIKKAFENATHFNNEKNEDEDKEKDP